MVRASDPSWMPPVRGVLGTSSCPTVDPGPAGGITYAGWHGISQDEVERVVSKKEDGNDLLNLCRCDPTSETGWMDVL